ncbi:hypothetical protein B7P34_19895 [Streptosporangium nondiastaticum]|uniref:WXG100 family type VII secretion target n=2 Tax=Actinomycetes TaxID=1760 RepID=A0A9X7PGH2_9ACTN|nr:hypothetical protein [Streptosporangium nondiastaticum]PSJ26993.1 hypothetical protein B7P34_19895 [Streptosporangium nondiastaticum]
MAEPDAKELNERAGKLNSLADHIESLVDKPRTYATTSMKTWSGPNADDTRGKLGTWKTTCQTVARALREEAGKATQEAKDLQQPKK